MMLYTFPLIAGDVQKTSLTVKARQLVFQPEAAVSSVFSI